MSMAEACTVAAGHDRIHRYVAGTLTPEELDAFEPHLLDCATCQSQVRQGFAIRAALGGTAAAAPRPRRAWRWLLAAAPAAALAALYVATRPADPFDALARAGAPPPFAGLAVRDASDSGTTFINRAMAAYAGGRWAEAAVLLERAGEAATPPVRYYQGAALLQSHQPARALAPLDQAAAGPYAAEARLLRAKAWLALKRADSALVDLDRASAAGGAVAAHARALADSVRAIIIP